MAFVTPVMANVENRHRHMGYSFWLAAKVLIHALSHYFCYTSCGALAGKISQWVHNEGSIRWPIAQWVNALTTELHLAPILHQMAATERKGIGNALFNDALNTFYLRLYGVGHMVKDHSDSERGNPLPPYGLLFPISSKGSFICIIPQTG